MHRLSSRLLILLLFALPMFAQAPAERAVDLTSADGTKLKGTYFPAAKSGPGVLLLHQCNKDRKIWDGLARQLSAAGLNVLTFDLRNFGDSGGKPFAQLTPQEIGASTRQWPADVDAAFQYLVSQPGVTRDTIGVGGASCGVNNSIQAARRHPEVKSLVLLAGTSDMEGRKFLRSSPKLPALFGVADDDEFPATIATIEWLYSLDPNPGKKFVRYDKGGHGAEIFAVHPEFEGVIKDWFVTTLIKTPGSAPASKEKAPISKNAEVLDLLDQPGGVAKVSQMLADARKKDPKAIVFAEEPVNILAYEYMQAGDNKRALEIMKLNAEAFPDSANVYDSLGDVYLADGQKDLALQNSRKALELLPNDKSITDEQRRAAIKQSAEQKLKQLGAQQ
ncbi:MAG TPA: alpha/beta fold hydrolase [Terriglobales bacterium]